MNSIQTAFANAGFSVTDINPNPEFVEEELMMTITNETPRHEALMNNHFGIGNYEVLRRVRHEQKYQYGFESEEDYIVKTSDGVFKVEIGYWRYEGEEKDEEGSKISSVTKVKSPKSTIPGFSSFPYFVKGHIKANQGLDVEIIHDPLAMAKRLVEESSKSTHDAGGGGGERKLELEILFGEATTGRKTWNRWSDGYDESTSESATAPSFDPRNPLVVRELFSDHFSQRYEAKGIEQVKLVVYIPPQNRDFAKIDEELRIFVTNFGPKVAIPSEPTSFEVELAEYAPLSLANETGWARVELTKESPIGHSARHLRWDHPAEETLTIGHFETSCPEWAEVVGKHQFSNGRSLTIKISADALPEGIEAVVVANDHVVVRGVRIREKTGDPKWESPLAPVRGSYRIGDVMRG
jgi:hypothetical protein